MRVKGGFDWQEIAMTAGAVHACNAESHGEGPQAACKASILHPIRDYCSMIYPYQGAAVDSLSAQASTRPSLHRRCTYSCQAWACAREAKGPAERIWPEDIFDEAEICPFLSFCCWIPITMVMVYLSWNDACNTMVENNLTG